MNSRPFVSIVVPTRNRARLLRDCVESLFGQDYPSDRYEVIVVDDGSADDTPSVVRELSGLRAPHLRDVRSSGRGANAARNEGVRMARGDLIAFVDDDVEVPPTWLRAVDDGCDRYSDAECFGGRIRLRLEGKAPRHCARDRLGESELDYGDSERSVDEVTSADMIVRRSGILRVGLFNEALPAGAGDEHEWQLRLRQAGGRIVYLPQAWLWHRRRTEDLRLFRLIRSRFRYGARQILFERLVGLTPRLGDELRAIPRPVGHAIIRRCAGGLLIASRHAGRAWAIARLRGKPVRRPDAGTYPPIVSVVIPTRNRLPLLREAVASAMAQTFSRWELIVVDDASSDGTSEWLATLRDSRVKALRLEQHSERSTARNRGLEAARGEYVLFLDDDDRLSTTALETLARAISRRASAVAAVGVRLFFREDGYRWRSPHPRFRWERWAWHDVVAGWAPVHGQCLFRATAVRACGGYDPRFVIAQDHDLWLRLARLGPVVLDPGLVLEYRIHAGQRTETDENAICLHIRRESVGSLAGRERSQGERFVEAWSRWRTAEAAKDRGERWAALRSYLGVVRAAPALLRSPITGPLLIKEILKALLALLIGSQGVKGLGGAKVRGNRVPHPMRPSSQGD